MSKIIDLVLKVGSISGLVSLPFTLKEHLNKRSKFKFDFRSSSAEIETRDNLEFYNAVFTGYVKNQSNEQNSITDIHYFVWGNRGRTKTLMHGTGVTVFDAADRSKKLPLPILFEAKEGKHLVVKFSVCLTGTDLKELVLARKEIKPGSFFTLPKYDFSLGFEDVNEVLFDDRGIVRSEQLIGLWWTLPNTFNKLKVGNPLPYLWHMLRILFTFVTYKVASWLRGIGL